MRGCGCRENGGPFPSVALFVLHRRGRGRLPPAACRRRTSLSLLLQLSRWKAGGEGPCWRRAAPVHCGNSSDRHRPAVKKAPLLLRAARPPFTALPLAVCPRAARKDRGQRLGGRSWSFGRGPGAPHWHPPLSPQQQLPQPNTNAHSIELNLIPTRPETNSKKPFQNQLKQIQIRTGHARRPAAPAARRRPRLAAAAGAQGAVRCNPRGVLGGGRGAASLGPACRLISRSSRAALAVGVGIEKMTLQRPRSHFSMHTKHACKSQTPLSNLCCVETYKSHQIKNQLQTVHSTIPSPNSKTNSKLNLNSNSNKFKFKKISNFKNSTSIVRELHVYGAAVAVSARAEAGGGAHQHMG